MMLRCSQCGADASDWAARCPRCRASLEGAPAAEQPAPAIEPAPAPAMKPAPGLDPAVQRRRVQPKLVAAGLLGVVIVGAVVGGRALRAGQGKPHAGHPGATAPPAVLELHPAGLDKYTLVYAGADRVLVRPYAGSAHGVRGLPAGTPGPLLAVGPSLVVVVSGTVYSVTSAVSGEAARVGPGDAFFPSVWPDFFGYVQGANAPFPGSVTVSLFQLGAREPFLASRLPAGYRPEAHLGGAFLVSGPQNASQSQLRLWAPEPSPGGRFLRTFGRVHAVVGTSGTTVAWLAQDGCDDAGECPMYITDTSTGVGQAVAPPPGHHGFEGGGAFSPDGRHIAAFVAGASAGAALAIVDVGAATASLVTASDIEVGEPRGYATWTPDGAYVLFCGISGTLHAWNVTGGVPVDTHAPASYNVVAF
jgi:hypothetical protein